MKSKPFPLIVSLMIVFVTASAAAASNWEQFQKYENHTGVTTDSGPDEASLTITDVNASNGAIDTVPIILGDYVYVQGLSKLFKYNKNTMAPVSNITVTDGYIQNACPASDGNDIIYTVDTGYGAGIPKIRAINVSAEPMTELWNVSFSQAAHQCSCPLTYCNVNGQKRLYVGTVNMSNTDPVNLSDDGTYYAFNITGDNHTEMWNRKTTSGGGYYWAGAAVVEDYIVYGDDKGNLTSVNRNTGTTADEINLALGVQIRGSVTYNPDDSLVYVCTRTAGVKALEINKTTGKFGNIKTFQSDSNTSTTTPAYYKNETSGQKRLYVAAGAWNKGYVFCLNATNISQQPIWVTGNLRLIIQSSPAVAVGSGCPLIFVTHNQPDGNITRIKDNGGSCASVSIKPTNNTYALAGVAVSGDFAYFGNDNGHFYKVS